MVTHANSTRRFSNRVQDYIRYRPHYPKSVLDILRQSIGFTPNWVIADVGSGTGISSELFLENGNVVYGVEPNREMREAAEKHFKGSPRFLSIEGAAEASTLEEGSIDLVVAGQAFHWFDGDRARKEFSRILKPGGWVLLMWNTRRTDSSPFLRAYEKLLQEYGTDYMQVRHDSVGKEKVEGFFAHSYERRSLYNQQVIDYEGLQGRLLSSSYIPTSEHPQYKEMLDELRQVFDQHQKGGQVVIEYDTELYFGRR